MHSAKRLKTPFRLGGVDGVARTTSSAMKTPLSAQSFYSERITATPSTVNTPVVRKHLRFDPSMTPMPRPSDALIDASMLNSPFRTDDGDFSMLMQQNMSMLLDVDMDDGGGFDVNFDVTIAMDSDE